MNIFIFGGSGYLGRLIANHLCNKHKITIGTRNKKKISNYNKKIRIVKINCFSKKSIKKALKKIDLAIHLVGMNKVDSINNPKKSVYLKKKVTENIIDSAIENKCKIIYFSSIQVYKNFFSKKKINEKSKTVISNSYVKGHLIAEKILKSKKNKFNQIAILRLSSVFGANILNTSKELIYTLGNNFCYQAIKKNSIQVENPDIVRNFLPSKILISTLNYLILKNFTKFQIYNIGYKSFTLGNLSKIISYRFQYKFKKKCIIKFKNDFQNKNKFIIFTSKLKRFKYNKNLFNKEIDNLLDFFKKNYV